MLPSQFSSLEVMIGVFICQSVVYLCLQKLQKYWTHFVTICTWIETDQRKRCLYFGKDFADILDTKKKQKPKFLKACPGGSLHSMNALNQRVQTCLFKWRQNNSNLQANFWRNINLLKWLVFP